ncbi:MAG TPA: CAP domain-containing protein [Candidatus Limnocylindrales bacterium]|nr:CAP domain-containing protein [Candidatus Limnocylindrales bacterium]
MLIRKTPTALAARPPLRRRIATLLAMTLTIATLLAALPAPAAAADVAPDEVATMILARINAERVEAGLVAYRSWGELDTLAAQRAGRMVAAHTLSHAVAGGNVGSALDAGGIGWLGYGEIIATTGYPWGGEAAANIYGMWRNSPGHHAIMMSRTYNYIGIGVVRAEDGSTWVSAVLTESLDHTVPVARNGTIAVRNRDDIVFRWSASDPRLQTHTAGVRTYDVRMRRDNGSWRTVRNDTTATSLVLRDRYHRHWFTFRVQAKDARGNLSRWTTEIRVWVR